MDYLLWSRFSSIPHRLRSEWQPTASPMDTDAAILGGRKRAFYYRRGGKMIGAFPSRLLPR